MINAAEARELASTMEPLFEEAEATGKWLRNVYFEEEFSAKRLRHLQSQGQYVQGPSWWKLVERPNFLLHQGEWDTISLVEHEVVLARINRLSWSPRTAEIMDLPDLVTKLRARYPSRASDINPMVRGPLSDDPVHALRMGGCWLFPQGRTTRWPAGGESIRTWWVVMSTVEGLSDFASLSQDEAVKYLMSHA